MLSFLRKLRIRSQLTLLFTCTGVIVLTIILMIYSQVAGVLTKNNEQYTSEMFQQIKKGIATNCSFMEKMLSSTSYSNVVQNYMMEEDLFKEAVLFKDIDNLFANMQDIRDGIEDFVIVGDHNKEYFLKGRKENIAELLKTAPDKTTNYYTECMPLDYNGHTHNYFLITSTVYSVSVSKRYGERLGTSAIIINASVFGLESNKKLEDSATKFYLLDKNNEIYSSNDASINVSTTSLINNIALDQHGQSTIIFGRQKYIVNMESLPAINGKIISIVRENMLFSELSRVRKVTLLILVVALMLLSISFLVISNNILQPLNKLIVFMNNLKSGNLKGLKERINLSGYLEIELMASEFNSMMDEIDNLTHRLVSTSTRLYEMELEKKKAELGYLKSQINPHFLYNTLEAFKGTAIEEGAPKILEMAKALGMIFRNSIKGADMVELKVELDIVKPYIYIQQIRFGERFDIEYNFTQEALKCIVPKMILQPIVENAIYHGLETKLDKGHLCVRGEICENEDLHIWVDDDGVGIEEELLYRIRRNILGDCDTQDCNNSSIGIINVSNRLRLMYGDEYRIKIYSKLGEGTRVLLKIPSRRYEHV